MAQRPHQGDDRSREEERQGCAALQHVAPGGHGPCQAEDGDGNSKKDQGNPDDEGFCYVGSYAMRGGATEGERRQSRAIVKKYRAETDHPPSCTWCGERAGRAFLRSLWHLSR